MPTLKLVSFDLCPYVQRAAIALLEKGVKFERINIELTNKPEWFLKISPLGKVPVLLVDEQPIFESAVILEYLEETQPHPLHPADPLRRAQHRAWMEFASAIHPDFWLLQTTADQTLFESKRKLLAERFQRLEQALGAGPFFEGEKFSAIDAVFAPLFRPFDILDEHTDLGIFTGLTKVPAWRKALAARPSVRDAVAPDYAARFEANLRRQNGHFASLMKKV